MSENSARLLGNFNFRVTLRKSPQAPEGVSETDQAPGGGGQGATLGEGGFQECSGLDVEMEVQPLHEGGRNDGTIQRVGRGKYQNLVLKRGMFIDNGSANRAIWDWIQGILQGNRPVARYDGVIEVLDSRGQTVLATWSFERGLPAKVGGPQLNAKTGDIAIEELTIAHEGLRLQPTPA
jgi:phage tail-like protein